jgi:hypothetical protein
VNSKGKVRRIEAGKTKSTVLSVSIVRITDIRCLIPKLDEK